MLCEHCPYVTHLQARKAVDEAVCLGLITHEWKVGKKLDFHTPDASMIDMIEVRNTRFVLLTWPPGPATCLFVE